MVEGSPELTDHWRFTDFADAEKYHKYGWVGKLGNYGLRADSMPLRFNLKTQNADGTWQLKLVFPYTNVAATEGIKEALNDDFEAPNSGELHLAPDGDDFAGARHHIVNPEMPFAARDFAGKWQFAMDNLTCGRTMPMAIPIAVNNERRNKGKFISDFSLATKSEYPEFAEMFLTLREPACIVDLPTCADDPGYPTQSYDSDNAPCPEDDVMLTFTPVLNTDTTTYEIQANTIQCNGIAIVHSAITGAATLAALVVELNENVSALGTWAVSGSDITLVGTACDSAALPWTVTA